MKYPKCSNSICIHNDKYLCKAEGYDKDIVCKQGKDDAIKKIRSSTIGKTNNFLIHSVSR
jgi:hypothetical protein